MRTSARMTGAALVVTAALALTGCNGSSSHGSHKSKHKSSSSKHKSSNHKSSSGGKTAAGSGAGVHADALVGNWHTGSISDNDYVVMVLNEQGVAVVHALGGGLCKGSFEQAGRNVHIETSCDTEHQFDSGLVKKYKLGKMTVKWDSGETDTFTKGEDLPTP